MPRLGVPRLRLSLGAMLAAVAMLVAMVCLPAAAFAIPPAGNSISIISAGPTGGNPYQLTVQVNDPNGQLISPDGGTTPPMTVHIFNSSNVDVYDVTTMAFVTGPQTAQVWQQTDQIPQAVLPAGTYTMTLDMYDTQESDIGVAAPAPLSFSYTTSFSNLQANPPSVTQGSQYVTFTGNVTGVATGGTPVALPNVPVYLDGGTTSVATTDSLGNFSYPVNGITQSATYTFSVNADPGGTYSAATASVSVPAQPATTGIQVTPSSMSVTEGSPGVTFNGNVMVTPPLPAAQTATSIGSGVPVDVSINGGQPTQISNPTDPNGNFSYSAQPISATTTYTFSVASTNLYSSAASTPVTIAVNPAQSSIAVTSTPGSVTYGSQNVTFNGTVTALPPPGLGTTAVPVPNAQVYLNGTTPIAMTDINGKFSYPVSGITAPTTTDIFSINQTSLYFGSSYTVTVNAVDGPTNVAVTANPSVVYQGSSTVTFSGVVTVGTSSLPVPVNTPVYVSVGGAPRTQVAMTDSTGSFTYTPNGGVTKTDDYNFMVDAGTLYTAGTYDVSVKLGQLTSNLTVTPDQTSVTEGSQTVTFTGTLTGIQPGQTASQPIANAQVYLNGSPISGTMTNTKGQFIYQVSSLGNNGQFDFSVASAPNYTQATANVAIGAIPAATRFTGVTVVPAHLKYGQKATLTGTVQYLYGTTWTALPGTTVHFFEGTSTTPVASAITGQNGSFAATLPTTHGAAWRATVSAAPLIQQVSTTGNLSISVPLRVKSFAAALDVLGNVKTNGCLEVTLPVRYAPESKIVIQYAATSRGPWKILGRLQLHSVAGAPALCRDANESYFGGSIHAKLANAYYRADFPGNYSFQPAVSNVIHSWRYQTKITDYKVNPRAVSTGGNVKISGRLWWHGTSWKPYGRHKVDIIYNEKGTSYWAHLGNPVSTNAGGYFSGTAQGGKGTFVAIIYAVYAGSKTDLQARSPGIAVAVNEASAPGPTGPAPGRPGSKLPVLSLPTYRGLGALAQDAVQMAIRDARALAFWPR